MEIKQLVEAYRHLASFQTLSEALNSPHPSRLHLKGLNGSAITIYLLLLEEQQQNVQLCILADKEESAFFYNDLEQLRQEQDADIKDKTVLFFPAIKNSQTRQERYNQLLRTNVLQRLNSGKPFVLVTYAEAVCEKTFDKKSISTNTIHLSVGQNFSIDELLERLSDANFEFAEYVVQPGEFTLRGGMVDVFSFSQENPIRIEFFGDEIVSIRSFDIGSQLTKSMLADIDIIPDIQLTGNEEKTDFFSLLTAKTNIWVEDIEAHEQELKKILLSIGKREEPDEIEYISAEDYKRHLLDYHLIEFGRNAYAKTTQEIIFSVQPQLIFNKQFDLLLQQWIEQYQNGFVNIFGTTNENQAARVRNIVRDLLQNDDNYKEYSEESLRQFESDLLHYVNISLHEGFIDNDSKIAFYTDHQVFNRYHRYKIEDKYKKTEMMTLKDLYDLQPGDYVTHIDHGIGQYAGLEKIQVGGKQQESIKIIYKDNDILYISIHSLHRIAKYSGKDGVPPKLNRLGGNNWNKVKERTKSKVKELVFDLAKLYAERKSSDGFAFSPDTYMQTELEASFIYEDTPDQVKTTQDVKRDMEASYPMDRLICGDVGFGKTEIAIRAAFKAVCDSKQVAVLVPTTVLALQHYNTFRDRLANFPCSIDYVNRFRSQKQQKEIFKKLKEGQLDIIIGTHKLLSKDVEFKDLGLLIVDEEQKFGVGAKEKLRRLKINVDTLTMTATPIPRTLQFSLMGARDISIMRTPPLNRYPIETTVCVYDENVLFSAIEYEIFRGGQVFVVNNRIQNIEEIASLIQSHFPNQKVAVGHGQMEGEKLERIMMDFVDGYYDILVATTIIESGLDIPNANTIIINEAQNYGLSELHQLRGRVGRKNKKAFCYLLTPPRDMISDVAKKRLDAIAEFSDIGSGFNIAMRDLDIRGAGNLLGAEQSGFITEIGYEMYQKILEEALEEMKIEQADSDHGEEDLNFVKECVVETDLELLIPDNYVAGTNERLSLYKAMSSIANEQQMNEFKQSLVDRFGKIPPQTEELLLSIKMRNVAKQVGFEKIVLKQNKMVGHFVSKKNSPYFSSRQFLNVLNYIQVHQYNCHMKELPDRLQLTFDKVSNVSKALEILNAMLLPKKDSEHVSV